ncbi:MAG TPA: ABC-2 family transporter protein [Pirellulaceae bacterium]|nr:ABC-2 family transporter protein [Pirellulaceae bacterium]
MGVFLTFAKNSLVRNMMFRANFIIECLSSVTWTMMNLGFYLLIFHYTPSIGKNTGWGEWEFFAFLATTMLINSLVQAFFMPNCEDISELIRTGGLDFALLKPIDTQFLISLEKVDWSSLANFLAGVVLLVVSLFHLTTRPEQPLVLRPEMIVLYVFYVLCGVAILYSLMIGLSATSIWLGQNSSLYDFWFYITNFSRYPMEIYSGRYGTPLRLACTFIIPVLIVVNVPARIIARPLAPDGTPVLVWPLAAFALVATAVSLAFSRWVFVSALRSYRSASS